VQYDINLFFWFVCFLVVGAGMLGGGGHACIKHQVSNTKHQLIA